MICCFFVLSRGLTLPQYVDMFKRSVNGGKWLRELSGEEKEQLMQLEDRLSFEDIVYFRRLARKELALEEKNPQLR